MCLQSRNLDRKIPIYDGQLGFHCKINIGGIFPIPAGALGMPQETERPEEDLSDPKQSLKMILARFQCQALPSLTTTISPPTGPCLGQSLLVVIVAPLKYLFGVSQHP